MTRFIDSAIVIMFVAVVLFCSDAAYTHAIFRELMLDGDILERGIYNAMYNGFMLNFKLFLSVVFYGVTFPLAGFLLVALYLGYHIIRSGNTSKIQEVKGNVRRLLDGFGSLEVRYALGFFLAFVCVVSFVLLIVHHEKTGEKKAISIRDSIVNRTAPVVIFRDFDRKLYFLYCGASKCAAFDAQDKTIRYYLAEGHNVTSEKIKTTYKS